MKCGTQSEAISHLSSFKKRLLRLGEQGFSKDGIELSSRYKEIFTQLHDISPEGEEKKIIKTIIPMVESFCDEYRYKNPHYFFQKYDEMTIFHDSLISE